MLASAAQSVAARCQAPPPPVAATGPLFPSSRNAILLATSTAAPAPQKKVKNQPGTLASMGLAGCTALIAVNFTHPIEIVKTRLQVDGKFSFRTFLKTEGVGALWKGIQAGWLREGSYTSVKLGGYGPIRKALGADSADAPFVLKFAAGAMSGSIGSCIGNPFDVMKTMMMADAKTKTPLPQLMKRMLAQQGITGFYRGISANIARACVLNGTKMACYDFIKGFCMTCTVSPFDMLRTTLMNQPTDKKLYSGFADAAVKIFKKDGPTAFYRGFFPIWGRFAPQATLQLVIFEFLLKSAGYDAI